MSVMGFVKDLALKVKGLVDQFDVILLPIWSLVKQMVKLRFSADEAEKVRAVCLELIQMVNAYRAFLDVIEAFALRMLRATSEESPSGSAIEIGEAEDLLPIIEAGEIAIQNAIKESGDVGKSVKALIDAL